MMIEEWRPVPRKPYDQFYFVSNYGRIKSIDRYVKTKGTGVKLVRGRIKKIQNRGQTGYLSTTLSVRQVMLTVNIHRMVAEAFIPNPDNLPFVNHKDGNKLNPHVDNLEWCDATYNNRHAVNTGLNPAVGEKQWYSTISEETVRALRIRYTSGTRVCDLVKEFNLNHSTIWSIVNYTSRRHDGHI